MSRILWLSDIHFKKEYKSNSKIDEYFKKFLSCLEKIENEMHIDFILLSGDIAFSSKNEEYTEFEKVLLNKIKGLIKPFPKVLSIPGNHDVYWNNVKSCFFDAKENALNYKNWRNILLGVDSNKKEPLFEFFSNYSPFAERIMKFKNDTSKQEQSDLKENKYLFGYYYNKKSNILFILINSCWFSFGNVTGQQIQNDIITKLIQTDIYTAINNIIFAYEQQYSELGNQIYALELLNWIEIEKIIEKENPVVISAAHHHPYWLNWSEQFSDILTGSKDFNEKLVRNSDILLVGHDHVSLQSKGDRIADKTILLRAPKFFSDGFNLGDEDSFHNNWFTILDIDTQFKSCIRSSFFYDNFSKEWKKHPSIYEMTVKDSTDFNQIIDCVYRVNLVLTVKIDKIKYYLKFRKKIATCDNNISFIEMSEGGVNYFVCECSDSIRIILCDLGKLWNKNTKADNANPAEDAFSSIINTLILFPNKEKILSIIQFYEILPVKSNKFPMQSKTKVLRSNLNDYEKSVFDSKIADLRKKKFNEFQSFRYHFFKNVADNQFSALTEIKFTFDLVNFNEI